MRQQKNDIIKCLAGYNKGSLLTKDQLELIESDFIKDPLVAVHCKAGKGRTGLIISCFLLFTNQFSKVEDALKHYNLTRTHNGKALTIPS
jgi:phosphatidylinositol-3,4,5-trisphosphate 3-phosphatase/dual-specificity protein phosphatase PTEN